MGAERTGRETRPLRDGKNVGGFEEEEYMEHNDFSEHFAGLERQAEEMKQSVPGFDLGKELENPLFVRLTSPYMGVAVEDAFYTVHRRELQEAAAKNTAEKLSNAIQAGGRRPEENGLSGKAASVTVFDYRKASPEQKMALKRRIREAAARGEKVYPGR